MNNQIKTRVYPSDALTHPSAYMFVIRLSKLKWSTRSEDTPDCIDICADIHDLVGGKKALKAYINDIVVNELKLPGLKNYKYNTYCVDEYRTDCYDVEYMSVNNVTEYAIEYVNINDLIDVAFEANLDPEIIDENLCYVYDEGILYIDNLKGKFSERRHVEAIVRNDYSPQDWGYVNEEEESENITAEIMYAESGCESFDEFIDMYNEGEL